MKISSVWFIKYTNADDSQIEHKLTLMVLYAVPLLQGKSVDS